MSAEQTEVITRLSARSQHIVVEATAGSGKTTTLVYLADSLPTSTQTIFLSFNRSAAQELAQRLRVGSVTTTLHALGFGMIRTHLGRAVLLPNKQHKLALTLVEEQLAWSGELADLAATYLADLITVQRTEFVSLQEALKLREKYGVTAPVSGTDLEALHGVFPQLIARGTEYAQRGIVDYPDLLYQPVKLGIPAPHYDVVCVDEAQDLSPASFALVKTLLYPGTTAVFVGDPKQAIYGFAGAESGMMDRIVNELNAERLPLSVSFRCPRRHVLLARGFSPSISPRRDAPIGDVRIVNQTQLAANVKPASLVLARRNRELINPLFTLIEHGIPVQVLGMPLRTWAGNVVRQLAAQGAGTVRQRIERYADTQRRHIERAHIVSVHLGTKLAELQEDIRLAWALAHGAQRKYRNVTIATLKQFVKTTFTRKAHTVVLSTIHKAKGREADHVYVLNPEWFHVSTEEEANLLFVALTRAKKSLTFVSRHPQRILKSLPEARTDGDRVWHGVLRLSFTFSAPPRSTWRGVLQGVLSRYERSRRVQSTGR